VGKGLGKTEGDGFQMTGCVGWEKQAEMARIIRIIPGATDDRSAITAAGIDRSIDQSLIDIVAK